eukprot:gene1789-2924_t
MLTDNNLHALTPYNSGVTSLAADGIAALYNLVSPESFKAMQVIYPDPVQPTAQPRPAVCVLWLEQACREWYTANGHPLPADALRSTPMTEHNPLAASAGPPIAFPPNGAPAIPVDPPVEKPEKKGFFAAFKVEKIRKKKKGYFGLTAAAFLALLAVVFCIACCGAVVVLLALGLSGEEGTADPCSGLARVVPPLNAPSPALALPGAAAMVVGSSASVQSYPCGEGTGQRICNFTATGTQPSTGCGVTYTYQITWSQQEPDDTRWIDIATPPDLEIEARVAFLSGSYWTSSGGDKASLSVDQDEDRLTWEVPALDVYTEPVTYELNFRFENGLFPLNGDALFYFNTGRWNKYPIANLQAVFVDAEGRRAVEYRASTTQYAACFETSATGSAGTGQGQDVCNSGKETGDSSWYFWILALPA